MEDKVLVSTDAETNKATKTQKAISRWTKIKRFFRHILALAFWSYAILKLFVFDIDIVLVNAVFPNQTWLVEYRSVVLLAVFCILAILAWGKFLFSCVLYIILYPFLIICWHVPALIYKRRAWTLSVALFAAVLSALRSLRWTIIVVGFYVVGLFLIVAGIPRTMIITGMCMMLFSMFSMYVRTIFVAFRSSLNVFPSQSLDRLWSIVSENYSLSPEIKILDVDAMTENQRDKWLDCLQMSVLYGRVFYFVADKLRTLRQTRIAAAFAGIKVSWLFLITIITFSLFNFGLYRIDPSQYNFEDNLALFDFIWYSFQASFMSGVDEVVPKGDIARAIFMLNELTTGFILCIIVVFFVTGVQTSKNTDEMDKLINKMRSYAEHSERFLGDQFGLTVAAAVDELLRFQASLIGWILKMSPELDPRRKQE